MVTDFFHSGNCSGCLKAFNKGKLPPKAGVVYRLPGGVTASGGEGSSEMISKLLWGSRGHALYHLGAFSARQKFSDVAAMVIPGQEGSLIQLEVESLPPSPNNGCHELTAPEEEEPRPRPHRRVAQCSEGVGEGVAGGGRQRAGGRPRGAAQPVGGVPAPPPPGKLPPTSEATTTAHQPLCWPTRACNLPPNTSKPVEAVCLGVDGIKMGMCSTSSRVGQNNHREILRTSLVAEALRPWQPLRDLLLDGHWSLGNGR